MRTIFSNEEIAELKKNPCVFNCSERLINYTYEFKIQALQLHREGITAKEIWRRSGFEVEKWKKCYFSWTLKDWRRIVRKKGTEGLNSFGGVQYDKGPNKEEKGLVKHLELQVKYLEAENDFLARLRAKRAERNLGRVINTKSSKD